MLGWFKKKFGKKQAEEEAVEQKPGEVAGAEPEEAVGQEDTGAESVPESAEALDDKGDDLIKTSPGEGEEFFSISPKQDISFDIAGELAEFFPELSSRAGQEGEPPKSPVDREPVPGKPEASLAEEPETGAESQPVDDVVEVEAAVSVVLAEQSVAPVPPEAAETIEERESVGETGAAPGVTEIAGESVVEALTEFFPTEEAQPEQKAVEEAATPVDAFEVELEAVPVSMAEEAVVTEPEPEPGPEAAFEPAEPVEAETVEAVVAETAEDEAIEPPLEAITELPVPPEKQSREELAPEEPVVAITEREAAVESEGGASVEEALETEAPSIEARLPGEEKGVEAGDEEQGGERAVHPAAPLAERTQEKPASKSLFKRLRDRLGKTRDAFIYRLDRLFLGKKEIDQDLFEQLEEILITADLGVKTTLELIDRARKKVKRDQLSDPQALKTIIRDEILSYIEASDQPAELVMPEEGPFVIMVVGVNGVGKTTTIGKIAAKFVRSGQSVLLVAGDTFRAAAINQLRIWGERVGVEVIAQKPGADPSSVVFDGLEYGVAHAYDVILIDTAGRLHTSVNLMEELKKIKRVIGKKMPGAPHEVMLVLDATTGQNGISQAKLFHEAVGVSGLTLTKLDGTAKGGIVANVCREIGIPVRFIGIGEQIDDLRDFEAREFVDALFAGPDR